MRASHWLFTWRTYGSWLPGEDGFVGHYRATDGRRTVDHAPGTPATAAQPGLERYARQLLKSPAVALTRPQAEAVVGQLHETARFRGHTLDAVAVLTTHVHLVFTAAGEPDPGRTLADWKSYASRALNKLAGGPRTWWAEDGSK